MKKHVEAAESTGCSSHDHCSFANHSLERKILEFANLGAVPHCCFADLIKEQAIAGLLPELDGAAGFYASTGAYYEKNPEASGHCHGSIAWLAELFVKNNAIRLHASGGVSIDISPPEAAKLLIQAGRRFENQQSSMVEDINIADGEQMIFSTPDPELPVGFIEYLETVFTPLEEVAAVYVFSVNRAGQAGETLTIGVEPATRISSQEAGRLSCLIVEGVERFLDTHDQLDFMLVEDAELADIARSVSPVVNLGR